LYSELLGIPYKEGGCDTKGFDCRGLVLYLLALKGIEISETPTPEKFEDITTRNAMITDALARHCERVDKAEPGAVVTFWIDTPGFSTHLGFVTENGYEFIHILRASSVAIERLDKWEKKITGFYRVRQ